MARLADQRRRRQVLAAGDRDVLAVLTVSYHCLAPGQQRLFRLLSLHPGTDFDAYCAAALTGADPDDADRMLESLLDDNLLRQDVAGRYYFHDLIRDCARQLCAEHDGEAVRAARARLLDYYLGAAHAWAGRFGRGRLTVEIATDVPRRGAESDQQAVAALDAEHANLAAVIRFAAAEGWHRHTWQLVCALQPYLRLRNYDGSARELFERGLHAARAAGDRTGESLCLLCLTTYYQERGSFDEARGYVDQVIELSRNLGDPIREAAAMVDLGGLYLDKDELIEAYEAFRAAEDIVAQAADTVVRPAVFNNLGVVCRDLGRFEQALDYLHEALELERDTKNSPGHVAQMLCNIGVALHQRGEHRAAAEVFDQALRVSQDATFHYGKGLALTGLCLVGRPLGDFDAALEHGRHALDIARRWRLRRVECQALLALGEATCSLGDLDHARQVFEQARRYAHEYEFRRFVARSYEGFAHVAWLTGQVDDARTWWEQAVELYPKDIVDSTYAQHHRAALHDRSTVCFRCATEQRPA